MDIQQSRTQTLANSERASKTGHKTIYEGYLGPHWYSCRAKETIHLKLCNINSDSGIEIPEL